MGLRTRSTNIQRPGSGVRVIGYLNADTNSRELGLGTGLSVSGSDLVCTIDVSAAIAAHVAASDPHGDRAYSAVILSSHVAASDPHGDRAYAVAAVATHEADTTNVHGIPDTSTLYRSGGTDVAVADGGTGASTAANARTNLGAIGGVTGSVDNAIIRADGTGGATTQAGATSATLEDDGRMILGSTSNGSNPTLLVGATTSTYGANVANGGIETTGAIGVGTNKNLLFRNGTYMVTLGWSGNNIQFREASVTGMVPILMDMVNGHVTFGGAAGLKSYTVATLPTPATAGRTAYASNGRKSGEGSGAGTGVPVWDNGSAWKTFYDNTTVAA